MPATKKIPFMHKIAALLDIPLDTLIDWPRVIMSGNKSLVIQNHLGVIEYDQTILRVNTKLGEVKVSGNGLILLSALKEDIVIEGKIAQVELIDWR